MTSLRAAVLFLAVAAASFAIETKEFTVSSATSTTITNTQHAFNSANLGVFVVDNSGYRIQPGGTPGFSVSINSSTYAVTVTFGSTFSGKVKLTGPFTSTTSNASDFAPATGVDYAGGFFSVCGDCTSTTYALRAHGGSNWFANKPSKLTLASSGGGGTVYAWIENQKVVYGYTGSTFNATCTGNCELRTNQTGFPSGVLQVGKCDRGNTVGQWWISDTFTDSRPW